MSVTSSSVKISLARSMCISLIGSILVFRVFLRSSSMLILLTLGFPRRQLLDVVRDCLSSPKHFHTII